MSLNDSPENPEELAEKMRKALEVANSLPPDTFAAVPDDQVVTLEISGQFGRVLNRALEYLYQAEDEETVLKAAHFVKTNFEGADPADATPYTITLWAISNLCADFSVQAGIQKKTQIYDREKFISNLFGNGVVGTTEKGKAIYKDPEPLEPLNEEELAKRITEHNEGRDDYKTDQELHSKASAKRTENRREITNQPKSKSDRLDKNDPKFIEERRRKIEFAKKQKENNSD